MCVKNKHMYTPSGLVIPLPENAFKYSATLLMV